jgi:hypothetical protein
MRRTACNCLQIQQPQFFLRKLLPGIVGHTPECSKIGRSIRQSQEAVTMEIPFTRQAEKLAN